MAERRLSEAELEALRPYYEAAAQAENELINFKVSVACRPVSDREPQVEKAEAVYSSEIQRLKSQYFPGGWANIPTDQRAMIVKQEELALRALIAKETAEHGREVSVDLDNLPLDDWDLSP